MSSGDVDDYVKYVTDVLDDLVISVKIVSLDLNNLMVLLKFN